MNYELIRGWHAALNSDEYTQGRDALERVAHGKTTSCCLGVLCRVAIAQGLDLNVILPDEDNPKGKVKFGKKCSYSTIPNEVVTMLFGDDAGIVTDGKNPYLRMSDHDVDDQQSCTDLNDGGIHDFSSIATCIKRTWPEAFGEPPYPQPKA